jgi:hypothetical protein
MKISLLTDYNAIFLIQSLENILQKRAPDKLIEITANNCNIFSYDYELAFEGVTENDFVILDLSLDSVVQGYESLFNKPESLKLKLSEVVASFSAKCRKLSSRNKEVIIMQPIDSLGPSTQPLSRPGRLYSQHFCISFFLVQLENLLGSCTNISLINREFKIRSLKSTLLTDIPIDHSQLKLQSQVIANAITTLSNACVKVICVDLDNTIWGGEIGEIGLSGIELGGLTGKGRAFKKVQGVLKQLVARGFLLVAVSKNTHEIAIKAIESHPEMVLRASDFVCLKIGWLKKSDSILELSQELGLGVDSFVFLDDSPQEREEVKSSFPNILCPDFENPYDLIELLGNAPWLTKVAITREDIERTRYYQVDIERQAYLKSPSQSLDSVAQILQMKVNEVNPQINRERALQLLNKTNQFNAVGIRYSNDSFEVELNDEKKKFWCFDACDKYGNYGLISVLATQEIRSDSCVLVDWVLSCRVIGKGVEEAILTYVIAKLRLRTIEVRLSKTDRNIPIQIFYEKYGLTTSGITNLVDVQKLLPLLKLNAAIFGPKTDYDD